MSIAFITTFYTKKEKDHIERLKGEIQLLGFNDYRLYVHEGIQENRGYAYGINQGIKKAVRNGADIFIIMNPDISLRKVDGIHLLEGATYFDIWGFALRQDGKTYYGGEIDRWRMSGGLREERPRERFSSSDFPSGSLMIIKKEVIEKVGLWDESYFLYYDEVDYCMRAKRAGFKIGIDSKAIYDHFELSKTNPGKRWYLMKSRIRFLLKYGSFKQKAYEFLRMPKTFIEERETLSAYLVRERFILNLISLNFSSFVNKFFHFILFLFLIRYLKPSEYGLYTLVWAHIGLLSPLLDFGTTSYGLVYLPTEKAKRFLSLFSLRFFLSIIVFILTIALAYFFRYDRQTTYFIFLTSFVIFSNMVSGSFLIISSQEEKVYMASAASMLFNAFMVFSFIVSLIFFKSIAFIFAIIFFFHNAYSIANFFLISKFIKKLRLIIDFRSWYSILKKSSVFLLISLFAGLYFKLDVFLLNFFKGKEAVGIYSSGYKFLEASMIFASSYNVASLPILSRLSKSQDKTQFVHKIKKDFLLVVLVSGLFSVFLFSLSPVVLPFLMPSVYRESIAILRIVIFSLPFIMMSSVFLNSLYVLNRAYLIVFLFLFQVLFNFSLNYFLIPKYSYYASASITLIGEIINAALTFFLLRFFIRKT